MTIVEADRAVVGGVDTHLDVHVAAALDSIGGLLGVESFPVTARGYRSLLEWLAGFGTVTKVGVEGTGAYGAGLARFLARAGIAVIEVDRPNRQARRQKGKSDPEDAIEAARGVLSGRVKGAPKSRDGNVEAIRVLLAAKRSARESRLRTVHQMRQLSYTAPDQLRERLKGLSSTDLVVEAASLRPRSGADRVRYATQVSLASLGRRALELQEETERLDNLLAGLVEETAPSLLGVYGVGVDTAAELLVAAGDNPERLRSEAAFARLCGVAPIEASSGKVKRYRLNRGGNRDANQALWRIVMTRLAFEPRTRDYMARRTKEGRSKREIIRILKRYVAREVYRHLTATWISGGVAWLKRYLPPGGWPSSDMPTRPREHLTPGLMGACPRPRVTLD